MQFGIREICDVVFKAKNAGNLGSMPYVAGQPVLYIDSAKTSTMEGAATTVYAQGGKGNARLIAWEGERTLTFTVEDALLSELGFAILSGAGLMKSNEQNIAYVHTTSMAILDTEGKIDLKDVLGTYDEIDDKSPVFVMEMNHGSISKVLSDFKVSDDKKSLTTTAQIKAAQQVLVDFYVAKTAGVTEMTIDVENFAGYYYVEASTLFRRQSDGKDLPAELVFPNVKIQSNFTFAMAATGDPSTFTFTMDAMPGYTRFDRTKKVLCVMQVVDEEATRSNGTDSTNTLADETLEYPLDVDSVTISFEGGEGANGEMAALNANYGVEIALTKNTFEKAGSTFKGWKDAATEIEYEDGDLITPLGDMTLTAQWTPVTTG